jgi:hypothetical protein
MRTTVKNPTTICGVSVVNDILEAVNMVQNGETVARFEWGDSMQPILKNGEYGIISPVNPKDIQIGDAVLCKVNGYLMTHMVMLKSNSAHDKPYFLIGSTSYDLYGWTSDIYGIVKGTNIFESGE